MGVRGAVVGDPHSRAVRDLESEEVARAWHLASAKGKILGPLATRRVRQIIARYSPELAGRASYHNTELTVSEEPS